MELLGVLDGILFVVGNDGITIDRLSKILEIEEDKVNYLISSLKLEYSKQERGIDIEIFAGKYKLVTKKEHREYYQKLIEVEKNDELSNSALETLAVIAYNSPVTRGYVDEIRGVDSSYQIKKLLYRNLIKEIGRSDLPGRPILYSITDDFLDYLGLSSIEQLPKLEEVKSEEKDVFSDLYESKYREEM
jgi:segregation and condensation protein B